MRKIIVSSFITLDGVMQAAGGPDEDTSDGLWLKTLPITLGKGKKLFDDGTIG